MKRIPWFSFYPADWLTDANLRRCSPLARAAWIDILCLMHQCDERGFLIANGKPWIKSDICNALGGDSEQNLSLLNELIEKGVVRLDKRGAVFSKRMVEDETERKEWRLRQKRHRRNVTEDSREGPGEVTRVSRPSSSSLSSSSSPEENKKENPNPLAGSELWLDWPIIEQFPKNGVNLHEKDGIRVYDIPSEKPYVVDAPFKRVICAYKRRRGYMPWDRDWDSSNGKDREGYKRAAKAATKLLVELDLPEALMCLNDTAAYHESKSLGWSLETVVKNVMDWKAGRYAR